MSKEYWKPGNMLYPVPAVMVSCGREGEKPNIITVAWAGTICSDPAMVSISVRKERYSHDIIKETEYLCHIGKSHRTDSLPPGTPCLLHIPHSSAVPCQDLPAPP